MESDRVDYLVRELFAPINASLDYIFAAGVLYGATHLAGFAWSCLKGIRTYFVPFGRSIRRDLTEEFGKWAVITGATSGIGLAFAHELASRKVNVVLISRSYDDLVQIVSGIQSTYSVQAYGIHADFSLGAGVFMEIEDALAGYEIGILVNNVAISYDHPQYFALVPPQRVWQLINVNIAATTVMTHMLLPQMLERKRGAIINVCSNAACTPATPLTTAYQATMAYVNSFSRALHYESHHRGILVQTLLPCFVAKEGISPSLFTPEPSTYASNAIATLGVSGHTCGYWPHGLQNWLCGALPQWLWIYFTSRFCRVVRKRCLRAAVERGDGQVFARKRYSSASGYTRVPQGRRVSNLSLRRSPSPHRKISTPGRLPSLIKRPNSSDPLRRVNREENGSVFSPSRTSSGSSRSSIPTIPETPTTPLTPKTPRPSSPASAMFATSNPLSFGTRTQPLVATSASGGVVVPPRRSLSVSSIEQGRHPLYKKHFSRVLVVPSVALSQDKDKTATPEKELLLELPPGQEQPEEAREEPALEPPRPEQPEEAREEPALEPPRQEQPEEAREEPALEPPRQEQPEEAREEPALEPPRQEQPEEAREEPALEPPGQEQPEEAREEPALEPPSQEQPEDTMEASP